jgi:RNA polymerase sigma-70 factor (ECF subfamily)
MHGAGKYFYLHVSGEYAVRKDRKSILFMAAYVQRAQDLTQEVFIKALQHGDQIRDPERAAHWLSRVATNAAIDFLRRHGRVNFTAMEDLAEPLASRDEESPEQYAIRTDQRTKLEAGLRRLSPRDRMALLLRDVEGLPAEEVARHLKCSKATVRSHIANARVKFRKFLERTGI